MLKIAGIFFSLITYSHFLFAQENYSIKVELDLSGMNTLFLMYQLGNKQYIEAESTSENGEFNFTGDYKIPVGIYSVVHKESNSIINKIIVNKEQDFEVKYAKIDGYYLDAKVTGSTENQLYYEYNLAKHELLRTYNSYQDSINSYPENQGLKDRQAEIVNEAENLKSEFIHKHPNFLISKVLKANTVVKIPSAKEVGMTEQEYANNQILLYRKHYFDNTDFTETGLTRTKVLYDLTHSFLDKLYPEDSSSQIQGIEILLNKASVNNDIYKVVLSEVLNRYTNKKSFDGNAVYSFLVDNYYRNNRAPWISSYIQNQMVEASNRIKKTNLGKIAPSLKLKNIEDSLINSTQLNAKYRIILFWSANKITSFNELKAIKNLTDGVDNSQLQILAIDKTAGEEILKNKIQELSEDQFNKWHYIDGTSAVNESYKENYTDNGDFYFYLLDTSGRIILRGQNAQDLANAL